MSSTIILPPFQVGKCKCRVWGRNQKNGTPGAMGTQCKNNAGSNGMCTTHSDPNKRHFGFYDEPRPTLWGISFQGEHLPSVPNDRKRGTTIPWRRNVIVPDHHIQPSNLQVEVANTPSEIDDDDKPLSFKKRKDDHHSPVGIEETHIPNTIVKPNDYNIIRGASPLIRHRY